ncbi:Tetratricopeptide repeat superfamily protein [Perilla frutescens var. hirtella]|uniref:Tetratricopeptide repeat superfamily protein n=1 Tax=Perilla frutescens var. hirtella TaxID=608512 RepID=A0AAD4P807_PERFH|nr:Tetratricopeptide repeat superfamily protein [Perilla frutescens var. hirtella]KAH6830379.1 Tetratricopeptide repeat superfamily protein [Perilla frutescens var. hirtella]
MPVRAPTFVSRRRLFEQKLSDLHKCTNLNELKQLHAVIYKSNLHRDPFVAPKLISALSLCRQIGLALNVFDQIPSPNVYLCNTLIRAYIRNSEPEKAFQVLYRMQASGVLPDNYTYLFLLKASSGLRFVRMIHAHVEKCNLYSDLFMPNSLIDAYFKCGMLGVEAAKVLFGVMEERDLVTYNSMITGLVKAGELNEAKQLFDEMPQRDRVSWNAILDGYVKAGEMSRAFEVLEKMPTRDVVSWSTVISGYAKMGDIEMAKTLFDKMPEKNLVTLTIMISRYAERGLAKEAIALYNQMEEGSFKPDDITFVSILSASAQSGLLSLGKRIHHSIMKSRYKCAIVTSNALIDMYCKCGSLNRAWRIFNEMGRKDLVSWNVMIHGLAMHGHGKKALYLFDCMKLEGFAPDNVTFVGVLSACNHAGMLEDGIRYFYSMESAYNIAPQIEHYGCMIDLLGRGGRLNEALRLANCMPFKPNVVIWCSLLGACRMHNALDLAEEVLDQLVKLDPANAGKYSMLSNVYAAAGDWDNAANARLQMWKTANKTPPGASLIELDGEFHEFTVMDTTHPKSDRIHQTVNGLTQHLRKVAYSPTIAV